MENQKIRIEQLASTVIEEMQDYSELTVQDMKSAVKKIASAARKEVQAGAPVRTGKYQKSWSTKALLETAVSLQMVVYSPSRYQLAHLLEFGHAKRRGGRTRAFPHIAPAEQNAEKNLEIELMRKLGEPG